MPEVSVILGGQALFIMTGRKGGVDGEEGVWKERLGENLYIFIYFLTRVQTKIVEGQVEEWHPKIFGVLPNGEGYYLRNTDVDLSESMGIEKD